MKGEISSGHKKYLWASTFPGCKLVDDNPKLVYRRFETKYWFLHDEKEFLRPTFDYIAPRFGGLFTAWLEGPSLSPREHLGALLLTPSANSDSLDDYSSYFWDVANMACDLLGRDECTRRIRNLENLGNSALRDSACEYLRGSFGRPANQSEGEKALNVRIFLLKRCCIAVPGPTPTVQTVVPVHGTQIDTASLSFSDRVVDAHTHDAQVGVVGSEIDRPTCPVAALQGIRPPVWIRTKDKARDAGTAQPFAAEAREAL